MIVFDDSIADMLSNKKLNPTVAELFITEADSGSGAAATSKMERFVIIVNGWKPLTIIAKRSILDVAAALDPPLRGRKLNISLVFIRQSYFAVPKDVRLNSTHYFVMKIPNKRELQQIVFNHSSDIDFQSL